MRETELVRQIQLRASELGWRLFRNNVGVLKDRNGHYIRYGLCTGSADLIGWRRDCGYCQFVAVEVKLPGKKLTIEQQAFLDVVINAGGYAIVATSPDDLK